MKSPIPIFISILSVAVFVMFPFSAKAATLIKSIAGQSLLSNVPITVTAESRKGLVVVFLSAKCPCSNSHITELKELAQKYTDFSYVAVHSNIDEGPDLTRTYFEQAGLPFPVIQDRQNEWADRLQAFKTPHAFVLRPGGEIAYQGGVSNSKDCAKSDRKFLREALEDLDKGNKVRTEEGRTLGCAIARGNKNVQ